MMSGFSGGDEPDGRSWHKKGGSPIQIPRRSPSPSGFGSGLAEHGRVHSADAVSKSKGSPGKLPTLEVTDGGLRFKRSRSKPTGSTSDEHPEEKPNFFDFDEGREDIFVESPETLVKKMRQRAKERLKQEAKPYTPDENVETIGGTYVEEIEERAISTMRRKNQPSGNGTPPSYHSSTPPTSNPFLDKALPHSSPAGTPLSSNSPSSTRDIIRRDDRIAALERELEDLKVARWKPPPIPETINRILLGQSYSLDWYKSLEEKRALLDAAIATNDGNCIIAVLLFIRKTLEHNLMVGMLLRRPVAGRHYCSFLKQLQAWTELSSIYRMLSDYRSYGYLKLQHCEHFDDPATRAKQLRTCFVTFKSTPELQADAHYVDEYVKLTDRQKHIEESDAHGSANIRRAGNVIFTPLTTTLLYCCRYHAGEPEGHSRPGSPEGLKKAFNISEKQFFQVCLMALSLVQDWRGVDELVTTKGVFGVGKKKKSPIGFERVVKTISMKKHRAPDSIIAKYLNEIEDLEQRLTLATQVEVFDVGIEALKQLRDKERLTSYINLIPIQRQREFRSKISTLLSNTQIRWK